MLVHVPVTVKLCPSAALITSAQVATEAWISPCLTVRFCFLPPAEITSLASRPTSDASAVNVSFVVPAPPDTLETVSHSGVSFISLATSWSSYCPSISCSNNLSKDQSTEAVSSTVTGVPSSGTEMNVFESCMTSSVVTSYSFVQPANKSAPEASTAIMFFIFIYSNFIRLIEHIFDTYLSVPALSEVMVICPHRSVRRYGLRSAEYRNTFCINVITSQDTAGIQIWVHVLHNTP